MIGIRPAKTRPGSNGVLPRSLTVVDRPMLPRRVRILMALLLVACAPAHAAVLAQSARPPAVAGPRPVLAHPNVPPAKVAAALKARATGMRTVHFAGFATDIATRDTLTSTARAPNGRSTSVKVPSPWLDSGINAVRARVATYVAQLKGGGAVIDSFTVEMPPVLAGTRLADATLPSWRVMASNPRASALASAVGIPSLASLGSDPGAVAAWRSAAPARADEIMAEAVDAPVRAAFPSANGPLRRTVGAHSGSPQAAPTSPRASGLASLATTQPAQAAMAPAPAKASAVSQAAPSTGASQASAQVRSAAASAVPVTPAAAAVLADPIRGRRTADWTGSMRYAGNDWPAIFAQSMSSPELRQLLFSLDASARSTMQAPDSMFRRPNSYSEISPAILDPRAASVGSNRDAFALALADCSQADFVRSKGVELAVMAVYAANDQYVARCNEILAAMTQHRPLQRPGWTLTTPSIAMPEGGDGVWLATNWGICGIVDMLNILGDRVPLPTLAALRVLLREEVNRIAQDWADKRPWYVRSNAVTSNQWIEPNVGLVKACLYLGDADLLPAYNLGVENLAMTLEKLGSDGAFLEGLGYATMTLGPLFDVIADIRANGDQRCNGFPFTNNAWRWIVHMHMPGRQMVNSYDCRLSQLPDWAVRSPMPSWVSAMLATSDAAAVPTMKWLYPSGAASVAGIRYQAAIRTATAACDVPEFGWFPSQQQVVWRSAWQAPGSPSASALGVWLKGGTTRESHTHRDQGHVSVYCGSRIVLMDCGTPDYSTADFNERYAQAAGHNIMQVGELKPRGTAVDAPVTVHSISKDGGSASIDSRNAYVGVQLCTRDVTWTSAGRVTIEDHVSLAQPAPAGTEFYRLHTGSAEPLEISGTGHQWNVQWRGVKATISADRDIQVDQVDWPDATKPPFRHRTIVIRATGVGQGLSLDTIINVDTTVTD